MAHRIDYYQIYPNNHMNNINIIPNLVGCNNFNDVLDRIKGMLNLLPDEFYQAFMNNYTGVGRFSFFDYPTMYTTMINNGTDMAKTKIELFTFEYMYNNYYISRYEQIIVWDKNTLSNTFTNNLWTSINYTEMYLHGTNYDVNDINETIFHMKRCLLFSYIMLNPLPFYVNPGGFPERYLLSKNRWTCISQDYYCALIINVVELIKNIYSTRQQTVIINAIKNSLRNIIYPNINVLIYNYLTGALYHMIYGWRGISSILITAAAILIGKQIYMNGIPNYIFDENNNYPNIRYANGGHTYDSIKPLSIKTIEILQNDIDFEHATTNYNFNTHEFDISNLKDTRPYRNNYMYFDGSCGGFNDYDDDDDEDDDDVEPNWTHARRDIIIWQMVKYYTYLINLIIINNKKVALQGHVPIVNCTYQPNVITSDLCCLGFIQLENQHDRHFHFEALNIISDANIIYSFHIEDVVRDYDTSMLQSHFNIIPININNILNNTEAFNDDGINNIPHYLIEVQPNLYLLNPNIDWNQCIVQSLNSLVINIDVAINIINNNIIMSVMPINQIQRQNTRPININGQTGYVNSYMFGGIENNDNSIIQILQKYLPLIFIIILIIIIIIIVIRKNKIGNKFKFK